jgi:hypothetical protein
LATLYIYNSLDFTDSIAIKYRAPSQHTSSDPTVRTRLNISIEVFKSYFVRVLQIDQAELRGAVELYTIAIFRPPGNRFYRR